MATGGLRSPVGLWAGGVAAKPTHRASFRSPVAFWLGGSSAVFVAPAPPAPPALPDYAGALDAAGPAIDAAVRRVIRERRAKREAEARMLGRLWLT